MKLLDLYCGVVGASVGYHQARFEVFGVDLKHGKRYPFTYMRANVLDVLQDKEYLNQFDFTETDNTTFNFLDSQLAYSGSATVTITGLDHLEGQTVSVLANGSTHPDRTVTNGSITLARSSTKVKVGLPYTSILQTMRIDAGSQNGTSQAKTKRIYNITVRLYESIGVEVGPNLSNMETIPFRSSAQLMDTAIPVYTGDKEVEFRGNYETDGYIYVRQTQPLPLTVLSLYPELVTNDG